MTVTCTLVTHLGLSLVRLTTQERLVVLRYFSSFLFLSFFLSFLRAMLIHEYKLTSQLIHNYSLTLTVPDSMNTYRDENSV